jgi:choline-sulfatase
MRIAPVVLLLAACGSAEPVAPASSPGTRAEAHEESSATPLAAPTRVFFDLARALDRAEIRRGDELLADLGGPAGAKYTLGGWMTSFRNGEVDGTSVAFTTGPRARLSVPWSGEGDARLVLRLKSFASGPLRLYVRDREIASRDLVPGSFVEVSFDLPAGTLEPGENDVLLRADRMGTHGGRQVGLAIDWLRLGAPSSEGAVESAVSSTDEGTLRLEAGITAGYAFEVPAGARVRARVRSGEVAMTLHRDGEPPIELGRSGAAIDADLSGHARELVRLDLSATSDVVLEEPSVVVPAPSSQGERRPAKNAIIYLVDTLRADKLRPYNPATRVRTPGLDRFVEAASTFVSAQTQENWTKPSVATLLSSLLPWEHTATGDTSVLPQSVELLPEILEDRGYHTGCFIANGYVSDRFGFRQGWATYRNYIREGRRTPAQYVTSDVIGWLDERPQDQPFFLYVHMIDPHVPYRPPSEFLAMYDSAPYRGPVSFEEDATLLENVKSGRTRLGPRDRERLEALYDGEISYHDTHFNALLDGLERRNLLDETVIVFTADHGEEFWDHGSVGHGHNVYQELLHIPMFVHAPGLAAARVDEPVGLVDVLPTVLDALDEPLPEGVSGQSMLPLLASERSVAPRYAVSGFMEGWRTILMGRYKLIHRTASRFALYDLDRDPNEDTDVGDAHPIAVRAARGMLGMMLARSNEPRRTQAVRAPHRPEATEVDAELEEQLRALGYVDSNRRR